MVKDEVTGLVARYPLLLTRLLQRSQLVVSAVLLGNKPRIIGKSLVSIEQNRLFFAYPFLVFAGNRSWKFR